MVTVDSSTKKRINNSEYLVMKQFSHFVQPDAIQIGLKGQWTGNALTFLTKENEKVIVIQNRFENTKNLTIADGNTHYSFELERNRSIRFSWLMHLTE